MYIRRDYSQSMFSTRRKKRGTGRILLAVLIVVALLAGAAYLMRDQIEATAMQIMGIVPVSTPQPGDLATEAMAAFNRGEPEAALALFEQAIAARPDNLEFQYEYGLMLIKQARYDEVIAMADAMILENTFDPRGFTLKARAQVWSGDSAGALVTALAGLEVDRRFSPLQSVLSRAYVGTGNLPAAIESGQLAVEYDPLNADAYRSYSYALNNAAAYDEAVELLEIAVSLDPQDVDTLMELAGYYLWTDRDQEAIDIYTAILANQKRNARAMLRLCDAYRKIGQFDVAQGYCQNAADTDSTYTPAQYRYGLLLYSGRDFPGARPYFEQCLENSPDSLECLYRLGLTYYYLHVDGQARAAIAETDAARQQILSDSSGFCELAWNRLQESLAMAQAQNIEGETLENIRLGLGFVSRDCAAYRGAAPLPDAANPEGAEAPLPEVPLDLTPVMEPPDQGA
jgi:tetratricopeptide (TPR) repeat protein